MLILKQLCVCVWFPLNITFQKFSLGKIWHFTSFSFTSKIRKLRFEFACLLSSSLEPNPLFSKSQLCSTTVGNHNCLSESAVSAFRSWCQICVRPPVELAEAGAEWHGGQAGEWAGATGRRAACVNYEWACRNEPPSGLSDSAIPCQDLVDMEHILLTVSNVHPSPNEFTPEIEPRRVNRNQYSVEPAAVSPVWSLWGGETPIQHVGEIFLEKWILLRWSTGWHAAKVTKSSGLRRLIQSVSGAASLLLFPF